MSKRYIAPPTTKFGPSRVQAKPAAPRADALAKSTKSPAPPPTRFGAVGAAVQAKPAGAKRVGPPPTRYGSSGSAQAKASRALPASRVRPPATKGHATIQRAAASDRDLLESAADRDKFQPWANANPTRADFEGLRAAGNIAVSALMDIIPADADDEWVVIPGRTKRGFKFTWGTWVVWGHEPDAGAAAGHAGAAGWTVRIRDNNEYLMDVTIVPPFPAGAAAYDWAQATTPAKVQHSHIALTGA